MSFKTGTKRRGALEDKNKKPSKKARVDAMAVSTVLDKRYALKSDIERKYFHHDYATTSFGVTGGPSTAWTNANGASIFIPALGDDISAREGRAVMLDKINIRGMIDCPPDTTNTLGTAPYVRFIVADLISAKGQTPLPAQLMTANGVYATMNPDYFGNWKILKDIIIQMPYMASSESSAVAGSFLHEGYTKSFHVTHKFRNPIKVKFTNLDGVGVVGAVSEHNIIVAAMASSILNNPRLTFHSVCSFRET